MQLPRFTFVAPLLMALAGLTLSAQAAETSRVLTRESVIARFAEPDSKFVDVDGINLHYKDQGSGPVVLLVHGTMGDLADWDGWAAVLAKRYRVLRFDMPAFGLSGRMRAGNYSADRMHSLIDAFMDQMGAERFAIAGTSYGGLVAFRYAATRTDRVTALILANSAGIEYGKAPTVPAAASASASAPPVKTNILSDLVVTAADVELNLRHVLFNQSLVTPLMIERKLAFANILGRGEESVTGRTLYERGDPVRVLGHVKAPALVMWGEGSKALNPKTANDFLGGLKNACRAELRTYPEAGHLMIVDKPAQSVADAMAFLDRLPTMTCRTATKN